MNKRVYALLRLLSLTFVAFAPSLWAQQTAEDSAPTPIPRLVKFSGTIAHAQGIVGVTFALYRNQTGGAPLWLETQNVTVDEKGRYVVSLGADHAQGLPLGLFSSGEARWLGVQPEGQNELERILLFSVPYALAAGDAQSLGGKPLSSFVLAGDTTGKGSDGLNYVNTKPGSSNRPNDVVFNSNDLVTQEIEFPTSLDGVTYSVKSFSDHGNETSQWSYNMSPTLYIPQNLTEPMIWFGLESNYLNPSYKVPTTEMYLRYMPIGTSGPTGYVEPFFSHVSRTTSQILQTFLRAERINLENTAGFRYATLTSTGANFYTPLVVEAPSMFLGKSLGINRMKMIQSDPSHSPYDVLAITSPGNVQGWRGTINLNVSYSAGTVITGLAVQANSDGTTASVSLPGLAGTGNAYACLDLNGKLYRSQIPCN